MQTVTEALETAIQHQIAARFDQAEAIYGAVLNAHPGQPNALYLYGVLALRSGRIGKALPLLQQAVEGRPDHAESQFALANAQLRNGDRQAAIAGYRRVLTHWPDHPGASVNLVTALRESGDHEAAIAHAEAALAARPAMRGLRSAYAAALLAAGHAARAVEAAEAALAQDPTLAEALLVRGTGLSALGDKPAAIAALQAAIAVDPRQARAHLNLANALADLDRLDDALRHCRMAVALEPALVEAQTSLAFILTSLGQLPEAIACCETAIALRPDYAQAHWNQGIAYLLSGDYARGWAKYEWRKQHDLYAQYHRLAGPTWEGGSLQAKTLLVHAEQGLGDAIQFCRFLPILQQRGARVVLACDPCLFPLLAKAPGIDAVCAKDATLQPYDLWVDQLSLPRLFGTTLATIPAPDGYLSADPARQAAWRGLLPAGRKIGLVWAGNPEHSNDARRSMPANHLAPILGVDGPVFVNLQLGHSPPPGMLDMTSRLTDWRETAALLANLDLVIAVDTAVAHLAGALGRPTWVMLPFAPDWRWPIGRSDCPWYSSMRLFRQTRPGDWPGLVTNVADALRRLPL